MMKAMTRQKRFVLVAMVAAVVLVGLGVKFGRHYVMAKRFGVVEEGEIYRSGELREWPLERVIEEYDITTILTLLQDVPDPVQDAERRVAREKGVRLLRIGMPGDGCADYAKLDRAADILADEKLRPILVHCAAGVNRTGAVIAAWRMKHRSWSLEEAIEESREFGYPLTDKPRLYEHINGYYERLQQHVRNNETRP
jgi:protein-tyrosine phosphatase